jgi:hypothetical protein
MNKGSYNIDALLEYCDKNKICLINDYNNKKITRDTKIEGKCINNCQNEFNKTFRQLKKIGGYCSICTKQNQKDKNKKTCLYKFGVDNPFKSTEIINKIKKTNLEKYGVENPLQCELVNNIRKKTNLEKYGVEYPINSDIIQQKIKETNIKKYGFENQFKSKEIQQKIKETNIKKYGFKNPFQNENIKNKAKQTCFKNYGVEYSMKSEIVKNKTKDTCFKKYGVNHHMLTLEIQNKIKETCLKKYGYENPSQCPIIANNKTKNSYNRKLYILPSGKEEYIQGYEHFALDKLIKEEFIEENDIITGCKNVPTIWYNDELCKKHRHYVDIFIKSQNRCIEVKSTWTAKKKKDCIFLKQNAAKELGYKYEIWVYNCKGEIVECHE